MDFRLLYSQRALDDLAEIVGHIAEDDAEAAELFGVSLLDHLDLLERFPRIGTLVRKRTKVRRLVHSPIVVYYQIHESRRLVEILHLRHGARKPAKF
jgi:plasmid stabilization system protein ParE